MTMHNVLSLPPFLPAATATVEVLVDDILLRHLAIPVGHSLS